MTGGDTPRTDEIVAIASIEDRYVPLRNLARTLERDLARLTEELDRYKRISESGESLGGELEERERRMELEAENAALRKALKPFAIDTRLSSASQEAIVCPPGLAHKIKLSDFQGAYDAIKEGS